MDYIHDTIHILFNCSSVLSNFQCGFLQIKFTIQFIYIYIIILEPPRVSIFIAYGIVISNYIVVVFVEIYVT